MKTRNLKGVIKAFAIDPLEGEGSVESFYVSRGESLVKLFSILGDESIKVLFSGHRGSGKTTELNYTETVLASKYSVLNLQIGRYLDFQEFDSRDILKAILNAIHDSGFRKKESLLREIGIVFVSSGDNKNLRNLKYYITILNDTLDTVKKKTGKNVLLFIDDLDKPTSRVEKILLEEGEVVNKINCSLVLTVPLTTVYSGVGKRMTEWFSHVEVLPIVAPYDKKGAVNNAGLMMLKDLVLRRMAPGLISGAALEKAALYSGGVFRYLVKIIQDSAFKALKAGKNKISQEDVENSISTIRSEFGRIIGLSDYRTLKRIHEKKNLINIKTDVRFIANDIVLEYQNGSRWVDIHPVIRDLLPGD